MTTKSRSRSWVDSTGLTTTTKGSYIEDEWKKEKRKYLKLHIMADKETKKIVGFRVTSEHTGDSKKFAPLVKEASKTNKIKKAYADTAYDSRKNFNVLKEKGIEPAIKVRKNARTLSRGSPLRRQETVLMKKLGARRMEAAQGLRTEVDRRDSFLIVQKSARRGSEIKEIPFSEG